MPRKFTFEMVADFFDKKGVMLLSTEYKDCYTPLRFICPNCGKEDELSFFQIKRYKDTTPLCTFCRSERFKVGQRANRQKYTIEDVRRDFEAVGAELLTTEYTSSSKMLDFICSTPGCTNIGHVTYMQFLQSKKKQLLCSSCSHPVDLDFIRKEFESKGAILLTREYKNPTQKLRFICSTPGCNNEHEICWINYFYNHRNSKLLCKSCLGVRDNESFIVDLKEEFSSKGATLLTTEYINNRQPLEFTCSKCGRHHFISYHAYQHGANKKLLCSKCCWDSHLEIDEIADIFESRGAKLLTKVYKNAHSKLKFECSNCGGEWEISWDSFNRGVNPDLLCQNCYKGRDVKNSSVTFLNNKDYLHRDFVNKYWRTFYIPEFFNLSGDISLYNMHHILSYSQYFDYRNSITNGFPLLALEHIKNTRFYHKTPLGRCVINWDHKVKLPYHIYDGFEFLDFNSLFIADVLYNETSMTQNYLIERREHFRDMGIFYMPFFLTEMFTFEKRQIVYSMIRNRLYKWFPDVYKYTGCVLNRFYARQLKVSLVESIDAKRFFEKSHIQGFVGAKVFIGLFSGDTLISCMAFSTPRSVGAVSYPKWELVRFATLLNTQVVGGASKLFKYFVSHYNPESIVSFCDLRFCSFDPGDTVYSKLGFEYVGKTRPNYRYRDPVYFQTFSRQAFQKKKLNTKLAEYRDDLSESELMSLNGYVKQYDCGNYKFIWKSPNYVMGGEDV